MSDLAKHLADLSPERRALLALRLRRKQAVSPADPADRPLARRDPAAVAPLSFAQQRFWLLHELAPEVPWYHLFKVIHLFGQLDPTAMAASLREVVRRHEVLRTHFVAADGRPVQVVSPEVRLRLPVADLRALRPRESERELARLARAAVLARFDLAAEAPLRTLLLALGAGHFALVLVMHHIVCDRRSWQIFVQELAALYQARRAGQPSPLPELPLQYADFAAWQRQARAGEALAAELAYWRQRLAGPLPVLDLPAGRPRPPERSNRGARLVQLLPVELAQTLPELARRLGASLFMTLLTAFYALLGRYGGGDDIVIGSPASGRSRPELDGLIGCFLNTLALRADLSGNPSFGELLGRVREATASAYASVELPFEALLDELRPPRDLSRTPLFQVMFVLLDLGGDLMDGIQLGDLRVEEVENDQIGSEYDLTLHVDRQGGRLRCDWVYASDLLEPVFVRRLAEHFATLLAGAAADPGRRLAELPLLGTAEAHALVVDWNDTASRLAGRCVHELIGLRAASAPGAPAVLCEGEWLAYGELARRARALARRLRARGVGPDVVVGICLERSLALPVALLGVLEAGGAYLPLDPRYPRQRLAYMLEDSRVALLVTSARLLPALPEHRAEVVLVDGGDDGDDGAGEESGEAAAGLAAGTAADHLAYVIYTSGSTGRPKGVAVTHGALANFLLSMGERPGLAAGDRLLAVTSLSFDIAALELYLPLIAGASLELATGETANDGPHLLDRLLGGGITAMQATPSAWRLLLDAGWQRGRTPLKVLCGGEALPRQLADELCGRAAEVWNLYGPTETAVWSLCARVAPGETGPVSIGRPIANTRVYLLDPLLRPVPAGVPGELAIGGSGVARGYLGRPELTAERFVPDPTGAHPGARVYRTGDLARSLPDGRVEFLGRTDLQVKVRGHRVELGEIEAVLGQHPAVKQVVVAALPGSPATPGAGSHLWLVAYLVPRREGETGALSPGELRAWLKERLPDSMLPAAFVPLAALPLTPNGKVDRRALPAPGTARPQVAAPLVAPRTAAEEVLARIWREVLRLSEVGVEDNFFEVGGDSILGMQIVSRAVRAGLGITPRQIFQHPTVAGLAAVADPLQAAVAEQGPVLGTVRLVPAQRELLAGRHAGLEHHNESLLLEVRRSFDPAVWRRAVGELLRQHDALRLRFVPPAGGEQEWSATSAGFAETVPFMAHDLAGLAPAAQREELAAHADALQGSLDLTAGPLVRVALFRLGPGAADRLLLIAHRLVADRASWPILLADLTTACEQLARGEEVRLPPKTTSFQHWAERLTVHARSAAVRRELEVWLAAGRQDAGSLPVDDPGGANRQGDAREVSVLLPAAETARLQRGVALYRASLEEGLLAALAAALTGWSGMPAALVSLEGAGREVPLAGIDVTRTAGRFAVSYPLLLPVGAEAEDPGELLKWVKERRRTVPGQGLSYGLLRDLGEPGAAAPLRLLPAPEVAFRFVEGADGWLPPEGWLAAAVESPGPEVSPLAPRAHLLEVTGCLVEGRLRATIRYSAGRHRAVTVEALAARLLAALRALVERCQRPGAGGYTPSDFPASGLGIFDLERLVGGLDPRLAGELETIYPFSPSQQGIFFFYMLNPGQPGLFVNQVACELVGDLDPAALRRAWQQAADRHEALRSFLLWEGWERPLAVVCSQVELPWREEDWRGLDETQQRQRLAAFLGADRLRTFELSRPPLVRLALLRTAASRYRLIWTFHQLILDGWSLPLLFGEVFALYDAEVSGRRAELPPPRRFSDFIRWLERQSREAAESYWRERLRGFAEPTPLAIDREPADSAERGAGRVEARLERQTTQRLEALARRSHLTVNTLVQGAWALLLHRYSGEPDLVFGAVVSGRPPELPGVESMAGLFISALPVRVTVRPDEPLLPWLGRLQEQQLEQRQYEHVPLEQIQRWSELPWNRPLFESLFIFENYPVESALGERRGGLEVTQVSVEERPNYPLNLFAIPVSPLYLWISFERRRFEPAAIRRMLGHLLQLLGGFTAAPEGSLGGFPLLPPAEMHQVLSGWNDTATEAAGAAAIQQLFEAQAARTPAAPAVAFAAEELSYAELNRRANRLAHYLRHLGIGPEVVVAICLERSVDLVVAVLAVLKSGGAYLPIDGLSAAQRLAFVLADARAAVLLTHERLAPGLPPAGPALEVVRLDAQREAIAAFPGHDPAIRGTAANLAYLIYTSGSTGRPKGVMVSHGSLINAYHAWERSYALAAAATCHLQMAAFSFDVFAGDLVRALCSGAKLVLCPRELLLEPDKLVALMLRQRVDAAEFVPVVVRGLLQYLAGSRGALGFMRLMVVGSDAWYVRELADLWQLCGGATRVIDSYGVSEATIDSCFYEGSGAGLPAGALVPVGRPFANSRLFVLDADLAPLPIGVAGELCLGGAGLARGYLARPDLTAERFAPDPVSGEPGARLYRTGDRARWLADGNLEFLGRVDHQVKVRGFRVEPGEIESVLATHPGLRQVAVTARLERSGERCLVAYVVPAAEPGPAAGELRDFLRLQLPEYMLPSVVVPLPALPLTASGKIDRRSLPDPGEERRESDDSYVAPRDRTEERLVEIYSQVLGISRVGVEDDFFALGGHSLLAAQLVSRIRTTFEVSLPLRALFDSPRIADLAVSIQQLVLAELEELSEEEAEALS